MKGILFKPDMIKAIVDGRKTQTRRKANLPSNICVNDSGVYTLSWDNENECNWRRDYYPRYQVGETVYVKEAIAKIPKVFDEVSGYHTEAVYKRDNSLVVGVSWVWKHDILSPMFLPESLARTFLKIVDVRAERLQCITEEDAEAEGVPQFEPGDFPVSGATYGIYKERFYQLWDSLNAKRGYGWEVNPWVWRYEFSATK